MSEILLHKKLDQYAKNIETGKIVYQRFSQTEQRGFAEGGSIHVAASFITGRSVSADENQDDRADRQEAEVETYAQKIGIWQTNTEKYLKKKYGELLDSGNESLVYYDSNSGKVFKTSNIGQYRDLEDALDSITLHNTYFPESAIKVIGFGLDAEGAFQIIIEQSFIKGTHRVLQEQIDAFVKKLDFDKNDRLGIDGRYKSSQALLNDLTPKNVILTPEGHIVPIDTIMHLNTESWGGDRVVDNKLSSTAEDS